LDLMESYRTLVAPMRRHVAEVSLQFDDAPPVELPRNLDIKVEEILGPDQVEEGSVVGRLDVIDVHNQRNFFKIYPLVGPSSIKCAFPNGMLSDAVSGIQQFVRITGMLHFKRAEKFPHLIKVSKIDVLKGPLATPRLSSLRGIAVGAYGGLGAVEHVEKIRNGDW
jgi:hypothetical protein